MVHTLGALAIVLVVAVVLTRVVVLRRNAVTAMKFGATDKTDFFIPPFALFYVYVIIASAFEWWPHVSRSTLFSSSAIAWVGVASCALGIAAIAAALVSFGASFRIGIDTDNPDRLVTSGIFAHSRNPMYVAFAMVLLGEFLISPAPLLLIYLLAGLALFHRQVLREEAYLESYYGPQYERYRARVKRYI